MSRVKEHLSYIGPQEKVSITHEKVLSASKQLKNWRAAGLDGIQNFWLKYFKSLHHRLALQFQSILDGGEIPEWLAHGRTVLIRKKKEIDPSVVSNYRPITCLSKLLTSFWLMICCFILNRLKAGHGSRRGA